MTVFTGCLNIMSKGLVSVFCKGVKFEIQIMGTCLSLFYYILGILMFFQSYGCFLFYWKILKDSSSFSWQYCYIFFSYHKNVSVNQDQNITSGAVIFSIGPGTEKFVEFGCYYRVGIPLISKVFTGGGQNVLLMTFFP